MKLINRKEGAELAGISFRVFWDYVNRGIIPKHCHVGGLTGREQFWRVSDVVESAGRIKDYQEDCKAQKRQPKPKKTLKVQSELRFDAPRKDTFNQFIFDHKKVTLSLRG